MYRGEIELDQGLMPELRGACPLWVKSGHMQCNRACPLYPRKRTCAPQLGMSALGHKRTFRSAIVTKVDRAAHRARFIRFTPKSGHFVYHRRLDRQIEKMIQRLFTKATR